MPPGEFRFAEDTHTYWYGDRRITGITEAMSRAGLSPKPPQFGRMKRNFEYAGQRGSAVHRACEFYDMGHLDEVSLDSNIERYLEAWKAFRKDYEYGPFGTELPMGHPIYYYGGTPDSWGRSNKGPLVVERKSRPLAEYDGFQLAGQDALIEANYGFKSEKLLGVQLKADGTYVVREYVKSRYRPLFLAAAAVANYQISMEGR